MLSEKENTIISNYINVYKKFNNKDKVALAEVTNLTISKINYLYQLNNQQIKKSSLYEKMKLKTNSNDGSQRVYILKCFLTLNKYLNPNNEENLRNQINSLNSSEAKKLAKKDLDLSYNGDLELDKKYKLQIIETIHKHRELIKDIKKNIKTDSNKEIHKTTLTETKKRKINIDLLIKQYIIKNENYVNESNNDLKTLFNNTNEKIFDLLNSLKNEPDLKNNILKLSKSIYQTNILTHEIISSDYEKNNLETNNEKAIAINEAKELYNSLFLYNKSSYAYTFFEYLMCLNEDSLNSISNFFENLERFKKDKEIDLENKKIEDVLEEALKLPYHKDALLYKIHRILEKYYPYTDYGVVFSKKFCPQGYLSKFVVHHMKNLNDNLLIILALDSTEEVMLASLDQTVPSVLINKKFLIYKNVEYLNSDKTPSKNIDYNLLYGYNHDFVCVNDKCIELK